MKSSLFNFVGEFSSTLEELALQVEDLLVNIRRQLCLVLAYLEKFLYR